MGEPQLQEERKPNVAVEVGKMVVKHSLLAYFKVPILIAAAVLFLAMIIGSLFFTFVLSKPQEPVLSSGATGWEVGQISEFGAKDIPAQFIPIYKEAGAKYHVPWNLLAAHHRVETVFSTIKIMTSPVGAIGHMQFMKKTWLGWSWKGGTRLGDASIPDSVLTSPAAIKKYGGYGVDADGDGRADPMNLKDAIFAAAKYLAANGAASGNIRQAVLAYNHSTEYLNEVLGFADQYVKGYRAVGGSGTGTGSKPVVVKGVAWPVPGTMMITSPFGMRFHPVLKMNKFHNGIDIAGPGVNRKPVVAFASGMVTSAGYLGAAGNAVVIEHGNGTSSLYGHLSSFNTVIGSEVKAGQIIGKVGTTGRSTGPHLHFGIKVKGQWVDPEKYLSKYKYAHR